MFISIYQSGVEMNNKKEFIELIARYEFLASKAGYEEIKKAWRPIDIYPFSSGVGTAEKLTGFGDSDFCSLCCVNCDKCLWVTETGVSCREDMNEKTYLCIYFATTPLKLRNAFRARAKHMKAVIEGLK